MQASRHTDVCSGHGCFPPRAPAEYSPNVFSNGLNNLRDGDVYFPHCCLSCHTGKAIATSNTVFINGKPAVRVGDMVSCGSAVVNGSPDVFIGG